MSLLEDRLAELQRLITAEREAQKAAQSAEDATVIAQRALEEARNTREAAQVDFNSMLLDGLPFPKAVN